MFIQAQEDTSAVVDTLSQSYADKWQGSEHISEAGAFVQAMASYDLIFVVLSVSLIIWFILLYFMIRVDRKVSELEKETIVKPSKPTESDET